MSDIDWQFDQRLQNWLNTFVRPELTLVSDFVKRYTKADDETFKRMREGFEQLVVEARLKEQSSNTTALSTLFIQKQIQGALHVSSNHAQRKWKRRRWKE